MIAIIATAIACFIVGGLLSYILFRYALKSKYDNVLKEAETEAEVIKKNKLLEVKEIPEQKGGFGKGSGTA